MYQIDLIPYTQVGINWSTLRIKITSHDFLQQFESEIVKNRSRGHIL